MSSVVMQCNLAACCAQVYPNFCIQPSQEGWQNPYTFCTGFPLTWSLGSLMAVREKCTHHTTVVLPVCVLLYILNKTQKKRKLYK